MENVSDTLEISKEPEEEGKPSLTFWRAQLDAYDNAADGWKKDVDAAFDEYLHEAARGGKQIEGSKGDTHFPLFWSCVRTIQPAFYSRTPVIVSEKAFKEMRDPVARVASLMLERLGKYAVKTSGFDRAMIVAVTHFIMAEKASVRVVFESDIAESTKRVDYQRVDSPVDGPDGQLMLNTSYYGPDGQPYTGEVQEDAEGAYVEETDYDIKHLRCTAEPLHYKDYRHTPNARYDDEKDWMSFDTLMSRQEVEDVFGKEVVQHLSFTPVGSGEGKDKKKEVKGLPAHKTTVTQIWDLKKRKVYYLSPGYNEWLQHKNNPEGNDPYGLKDFFPCPPFILGTVSQDDMFTAPAYVQLRDFINQVHGAFDRLRRQVLALKKAGVYDASKGDLAELNSLTSEGQFIGLQDLEMLLGPNGSLDRLIHFFPTDKIAQGVQELKEVVRDLEQKMYDLWGIPDIYRGITDPNETLGAQQLKGKHMSVRFSMLQREVQRLARDTIELMCDLYLGKCPAFKLMEIMGVKYMSQEDQMIAPQALELLKSDTERCIRINIETDSTITQNMNADIEQKQFTAKTMFEGIQALQNVPPWAVGVAAQAVEIAVKSTREGKHTEDELEQALEAMKQAAAQPPPQAPPDPAIQVAQIRAQTEIQKSQQDAELKMQEIQLAAQQLQVDLQLGREKLQVEMQKAGQEGQIEQVKTALDAQVKASEQRLDALRVEVEQYKAILSEREKLLEEKRLAHDQKTDKDANILEAISLVTGKPLPSDVRRKEESEKKSKKRKYNIKMNDDDGSATVESEEIDG